MLENILLEIFSSRPAGENGNTLPIRRDTFSVRLHQLGENMQAILPETRCREPSFREIESQRFLDFRRFSRRPASRRGILGKSEKNILGPASRPAGHPARKSEKT